MKPTWLSAIMLALLLASPPALGVDLTKIERTIGKEPVYQTKMPKYCLLVFGAQAKMRVWLVLDGKVLYVDRNGDGDLTGAAERVEFFNAAGRRFDGVDLSLARGKVHYSIFRMWVKDNGRVDIMVKRKAALAHRVAPWQDTLTEMAGLTDMSFRNWMNRDHIEENDFRFADRPQDAPIVHLDGPLTLKPMDNKQVFVRGRSCRFPVMVGTPGLGKGTFTQLLFRPGDPDAVAEIVFPHRDADSKPIVLKVALQTNGCSPFRASLARHELQAQDVSEAVGRGESDVAFAGEEAGDHDLRDAGFLSELVAGLGTALHRLFQGRAQRTRQRRARQGRKLRLDQAAQLAVTRDLLRRQPRRSKDPFGNSVRHVISPFSAWALEPRRP